MHVVKEKINKNYLQLPMHVVKEKTNKNYYACC